MDNSILISVANDIHSIKWILTAILVFYFAAIIPRIFFSKEAKQFNDFSAAARKLIDKNDFEK